MASRKEQKEAARAEREEQERAAQASESRRKLLGYGVAGLIAVAAVVAVVAVYLANPATAPSTPAPGGGGGAFPAGSVPPQRVRGLPAAARAAGCRVESPRSEGNDHVTTPVDYRANPPTSGDHTPDWPEDGAYATTDEPKERWVHVLEHGRIHVQYRPDAPDEVKGSLKALYDEDPYHMVLTPNVTRMEPQVAATTWGQSLTCPRANPQVYDAIRAFKEAYRDRGPEFIP